jgi:hypothetical protein
LGDEAGAEEIYQCTLSQQLLYLEREEVEEALKRPKVGDERVLVLKRRCPTSLRSRLSEPHKKHLLTRKIQEWTLGNVL